MKTLKFLSYATFVLFLGLAISSCTKEGPQGPEGPAGPQGPQGEQGPAGQDGNANVQTYVFNSPSWNLSGYGMIIDMSSILTNEIIENDVILGYVKNTNYSEVFPIPGLVWIDEPFYTYRNYSMEINGSPTSDAYIPEFNILIASIETDGSFTPDADLQEMDWFKCIIIESTNTTTTNGNGRPANPKQAILDELAAANVDINDYYAVCAYYGIDPK